MSRFRETSTLEMPTPKRGKHGTALEMCSAVFRSAGQPPGPYSNKSINASLKIGQFGFTVGAGRARRAREVGDNCAWTAMLRSRSSVGRRSVHIVSGSAEGRLVGIMMGEVKERSSWKERMCQVYLIQVTRAKTKCREYWSDIAVPWRLVSVECDEHLHRGDSTVLIML